MVLTGFTPPYTPTGHSSLVDAPPWHYAGQILSLAFDVERDTAQTLLPEKFGTATGRAYGHFCEWQACTDRGSELVDPVYAQYKEFFILIEAESGLVAGAALYCPFIYVDQDISIVRGWMQGWPKKLGSIWMTRSYPGLDRPAAAPIRSGTRFGASLAVKDRRLAEVALPDGSAIELNRHPIRGKKGAFMPILGPDVARPIDPGARRLAGFVQQIEVPAVLRNEGRLAHEPVPAQRHASIGAGKIYPLRRGIRGEEGGAQRQQAPSEFHRVSPSNKSRQADDGNRSRVQVHSIGSDHQERPGEAAKPGGSAVLRNVLP